MILSISPSFKTYAVVALFGIFVSAPSYALGFSNNLKGIDASLFQDKYTYKAAAVEGEAAQKFISQMGDKAISFLSNDALTQTQKESEFRKLINQHFDMSTIGRFALGKNWKNATKQQQAEYQRLFNDLVVKVYAGRFNEYKGEGFDVGSFQNSGKKDILVTSYIVPNNGSKVQVDWRVRNKNGQYKIIDVIIEGVSMSLTQRSDFSSIIQRGGGDIEVLLSHLR